MKIAWLGLGNMGAPMAENLVHGGHELVVYNRTRAKAEPLAKLGAEVADTPAAACEGVEVIVTMLADDHAVRAAVLGSEGAEPAIDRLRRGAVHVSMSTISPFLSKELAQEHHRRGQQYVAAPVFGRPDAAAKALIAVVAAGPRDAVDRCRPLFSLLGRETSVVGEEPARANVVKLAGNFLIAAAIEALGEASRLVERWGLEPAEILHVINQSTFRSPVYESYGKRIADGAFEPAGFGLTLGLKDLGLAIAAAQAVDMPLPAAERLRDAFVRAEEQDLHDLDWSVVGRVEAADPDPRGRERPSPGID